MYGGGEQGLESALKRATADVASAHSIGSKQAETLQADLDGARSQLAKLKVCSAAPAAQHSHSELSYFEEMLVD